MAEYYGYRFYDPTLQRWLNRDPISENQYAPALNPRGAHPDVANPYVYVRNGPLSHYDPFGLSVKSIIKDLWCKLWGKAKEKVKDKLTEKMKEWAIEHLAPDQHSIDDAIASCDYVDHVSQSDSGNEANWELECDTCAIYRCALQSTTILQAERCLQAKTLGCAYGKVP